MKAYQRKYLRGISSRTWEHPADRASLAALHQMPAVEQVVRAFLSVTNEKSLRLLFLASSVRATERQFPRVSRLAEEAAAVLDLKEVPEVFVTQTPLWNAGAMGVEKPFITVNSGLMSSFSDDELLAVLGHEAGHIASGHVLYKTLLFFLLNASLSLVALPAALLQLVISALKEWDRKSELSSDRAGLLTVQDPDAQYQLLMKLAGGADIGQMNIDEFFAQAAEYENAGTVADGVHKFLNLVKQRHPFPVLRLSALKQWVDEGKYQDVLDGNYQRREETDDSHPGRSFEDAAREYREELKNSADPLSRMAGQIGENAEEIRRQAESFFRSIFGRK